MKSIADAKLDSVPIIAITGQVSSSLIGTDAFQEVDTFGMTMPITKHNYMVKSTEELLNIIPESFRIAASGRPGPFLFDVSIPPEANVLPMVIPGKGNHEAVRRFEE